jgi:hypothetical protein
MTGCARAYVLVPPELGGGEGEEGEEDFLSANPKKNHDYFYYRASSFFASK